MINGNNMDCKLIKLQLTENFPWPPHDFIKGISPQGDRGLHADYLMRELNDEHDLRFCHAMGENIQLAVIAEILPWDSQFFGYGVAKLHGIFPLSEPYYFPYADYTECIAALIAAARRKGVRYLLAGVDPRDLATMRAVGEAGFSLIETKAYFSREIETYSFPERFPVRQAGKKDIEDLGRVAQENINLYDRFHADPFISPDHADKLMHRWVEASISDHFADVTLIPDSDAPEAFCTVKYHKEAWQRWGINISQPVFSAVSPRFRGWYRKLISEISYHLKDIGVHHAYMATQVTNKAVIHVWETLGYRFGKCENVFRILL